MFTLSGARQFLARATSRVKHLENRLFAAVV